MKNSLFFLSLAFVLTACSSVGSVAEEDSANPDPGSEAAQTQMCTDENVGVFRFSRSYLKEFCPKLKSQYELICLRFVHSTKEWHKACPGVDTLDKLECVATIQNGPSFALLESLQKCKTVQNRKQVYCLSRALAKSGVPLQPETVQECLDKNAS